MKHLQIYENGNPTKHGLNSVELKTLKISLECVWRQSQYLSKPLPSADTILKIDEDYLEAGQMVGSLYSPQVQIDILPKLMSNNQSPRDNHRLLSTHLQYYLSYAWGIRKIPAKFVDSNKQNLNNLGIDLLLSFFAEYLQKAPYLHYEQQSVHSNFVRGKLTIKDYNNNLLSRGKWSKVSSKRNSLESDNHLRRLLKYTLVQIRRQIPTHHQQLGALLDRLEEVRLWHTLPPNWQQLRLPPDAEEEGRIFQLCQWYLKGRLGLSWFVSMPYLFELFLYGFIKQHFPHWQVKRQSSTFLAKSQHKFRIYNDLYLPQQQQVLELKYKSNPSPAPEDLYQAITYALGRNAHKVCLIYPQIGTNKSIQTYHLESDLLKNEAIKLEILRLPWLCLDGQEVAKTLDEKIYNSLSELVNT